MDEGQRRLAEELLFGEEKPQSFAKRLFFGECNASQVFPYPTLAADAQQITDYFLQTLNCYLDENMDPDRIDREAQIPLSLIKGLAELGVLGASVPKEFGGLGMSQHSYCQVIEAIASRCGATAIFVNAHQSIGLKSILLFGSNEQKKRWLRPLATGEKLAAFALTEPNAGSDASGVETRAVYIPEKKVYRINGRKQWISNGSIAGVLTVMAQTEVQTKHGKEDKVTAFIVTPDMKGFEITNPGLEKVGIRGTRTTNLLFTDLDVPEENILGEVGKGLRICLTALDFGRTTFGAMCTGAAKVVLEKAIHHAKTRKQFKRPLASFGLVKEKIATMSALTYAIDASTYLTAGLIDKGVEDVMLEAAILKVFASDSLWKIIYDAMQIYGGRSFFTDEPLERMMRDARLNMIGEGSNEVMRAFIGAVGLRDVGMELKDFSDPKKFFSFGKAMLGRLMAPKIPVASKILRKEAGELASLIREFSFAGIGVLAKYREDIIEQQLVLNRITNCAIAIYTSIAVISKLDYELTNRKDSEALQKDLSIGKLYCSIALKEIKDNLASLGSNIDGQIISTAEQITGIKYP